MMPKWGSIAKVISNFFEVVDVQFGKKHGPIISNYLLWAPHGTGSLIGRASGMSIDSTPLGQAEGKKRSRTQRQGQRRASAKFDTKIVCNGGHNIKILPH